MPNNRPQTAVILAAGQGSKFWPYNLVRHKAAFPIANKPTIRRLVDDLYRLGVPNIIVVVGPGQASIRSALRGAPANISYSHQATPDGTAAAAMVGAYQLDEDFLVIAGDLVTARQNLASLIDRFSQEQPLAAALIQPLGRESPQDWLIAFPEGEQLRGVEGHSRQGDYRLAGAYAFRPQALSYLRDNPGLMTQVPVGGMPPLEAEIAQSLQLMIDEGQLVLAVETTGYHTDLDKPWHILEANWRVIGSMSDELQEDVIPASSQIHDGADIQGRLVLGENTTIGNRVVVKGDLWLADNASLTNGAIIEGPLVAGPDVKIQDYCQIGGRSSLGAQGIYGHGAEFSGLALERVYCYHYCEIWGVVGQSVDFGAATVCGNLRFDDRETIWRVKGRAEKPPHAANAAYFGDFSRTGVNAIIMPGRRIGAYSCIGPGVIVYEDISDRQLVTVHQTLTTRPWGPDQYGW